MLYSVRMRASKTAGARGTGQVREERSRDMHISGAEGLYGRDEISGAVGSYLQRALEHPRGNPDHISLTVEKIRARPRQIPSLMLRTAENRTVPAARTFARSMLRGLLISDTAIQRAFELLGGEASMRGAALLGAGSGKRLEPDRARGIRVSRLGLSRTAGALLSAALTRVDLNTETVREALVLASKVASCGGIVAEVCISDDPDYTTGYISSRGFGYIRVPHFKKKNSRSGGRVFFLQEGADRDRIIAYLEKTPVFVNRIAPCFGISSPDELLGHHNL